MHNHARNNMEYGQCVCYLQGMKYTFVCHELKGRDHRKQMTRTVYWLKHNKGHCLHYNISVHGFNLHTSITCSLLPPTSAALWKAVIGTFLHMFWECPVVISLWTHVNLVLSSLLRIDWSVNPSLCLLNDDSGLCISSMQKRMLFAGFTAAKKTRIQNWFTPHV